VLLQLLNLRRQLRLLRRSKQRTFIPNGDAYRLSMERGSDTSFLTMTQVELDARVREQKAAEKEQKLKYRGVAYTPKQK